MEMYGTAWKYAFSVAILFVYFPTKENNCWLPNSQLHFIADNPGFSSVTFESRSSKDNVDLLKDAEPIHYDTIDTSQEFGISRWESNPPKNLFDDV